MRKLWKNIKRIFDWLIGFDSWTGSASTAAFFIRLGAKFALIVGLVTLVSGLVSPMLVSFLGINPQLWSFFLSLVPSHLVYDITAVFSTQLAVTVAKYKLDAIPKNLTTFQKYRKLKKP